MRRPSPVSRTTSSDEAAGFTIPALPRHLSNKNDGSTPLGSPLARSATSSPRPPPETPRDDYDSSDNDEEEQDELVTGFDRFGVQRVFEKKKDAGPLVIAPLKNKDWRELARKRRTGGQYVPESAKAQTGADGSVGGLGTRETINNGPVLSGLQVKTRGQDVNGTVEEDVDMVEEAEEVAVEETDEQRALRALLAEANGEQEGEVFVPTIPAISETDALKQDVDELPDVATLDDYERVPISQFGAAMLRGMGWKEGQSASRKGKGLVEPYIPASRPALLGIGAKEQEVYDDGSKSKYKNRKPERRYVPVLKQEREADERSDRRRSRSPDRSANHSRRSSRSPRGRDREGERSTYDRNGESSRRRDRDEGSGRRDRDRDDGYGRRERERDYRRGESDRDRERDRDRDRRRDYDRRDSGRRRDH